MIDDAVCPGRTQDESWDGPTWLENSNAQRVRMGAHKINSDQNEVNIHQCTLRGICPELFEVKFECSCREMYPFQ